MSRPFSVLDVFTDQPFGGNRLAIVDEADGLDTAVMQAVASEFGFPETLFVTAPADDANHLCARIFTPAREIPFAGHPNVGLGVWALERGEVRGREVTKEVRAEELAGLVSLELAHFDGRPTATLTAPAAFGLGQVVPRERMAKAAGLSPDAIATERHAPVHASVGMGFAFAEVASREQLAAARPIADAFDTFDQPDGVHQAAYYVRDGANVAMRMFAPPQGILEDPATGSAAGALAGLLAHIDPARDIELSFVITQGDEMGRPSRISATASKADGAVRAVCVGGSAVRVMDGVLHV